MICGQNSTDDGASSYPFTTTFCKLPHVSSAQLAASESLRDEASQSSIASLDETSLDDHRQISWWQVRFTSSNLYQFSEANTDFRLDDDGDSEVRCRRQFQHLPHLPDEPVESTGRYFEDEFVVDLN